MESAEAAEEGVVGDDAAEGRADHLGAAEVRRKKMSSRSSSWRAICSDGLTWRGAGRAGDAIIVEDWKCNKGIWGFLRVSHPSNLNGPVRPGYGMAALERYPPYLVQYFLPLRPAVLF